MRAEPVPRSMHEFDFVTIGTGSGLDVANVALDQGQSVAVIEKGPIGGTCLNRGCIPSKQLLYHADVHSLIERSEEFHIDATIDDVDFPTLVDEVTADVSEESEAIRQGLHSAGDIELFEGTAEFVDTRTLELTTGDHAGERIYGETMLVAAGTRPAVPAIDGIEEVSYLTSREALRMQYRPDRLVIIGGGYIAAELGHFFGTFGSDITIVGRQPQLLPHADPEIAAAFTERYADRFDVYTGYEATTVTDTDDGTVTVTAEPYPPAHEGDIDKTPVTIEGDDLLVAAGRVPNTDTLAVSNAGIETDERGFIKTDEYLRTSAEGVWALGDIVGEYLLKHNANHEAQTVAWNVFGDELEAIDYSAMPFAVFSTPEVAGVGATEDELDGEYATRTYQYGDTARGDTMNADGFVKAIIDFDGQILGCHIIGPDASTLIQEVVVAMKAGNGTLRNIREAVHVHPALPEVVQRAFMGQFVPANHEHEHDHEHSHDHHEH